MTNANARRRSLRLCVVFCISVGSLIILSLHHSHQQVEAYAERALRHSSDLIAEWIMGAFTASDYVLRDVAGHIDPTALSAPDAQTQQRLTQLLLDKQATVPYALLIGAFNVECVATHVNGNVLVGFDAREREYCQALRDDPTRDSVVTHGFTGKNDQWMVVQARRLLDADGAFAGLVAIGIDLAFFDRWLAQLNIGPEAGIAIIDHNGLVLALRPQREGVVGQTVLSPMGEAFLASQERFIAFKDQSSLDGVERLFGMRRVTGLPFAIVMGLSSDDYLWTWRIQMVISLAMLLMLWTLAIVTLRKHWALIEQSAQFEYMAHKDALTQIPNRGYFTELAERERHKAQRHRTPLSLLLLDVDQFKRINDCHGHAAGDRALIAFKDACQQVLRDMDIFGRWGGDEFVVLVPDGYESAYTVAERVRQAVKQVKMVDDQGKPFSLRTTIGFASTNSQIDEVPTLDELLACADRALYSAKEAGRNRVKGVLVV